MFNLQMLIATKRYLENLKTPVFSGNESVSGGTDQIITIPCYNEPAIEDTIQSLIQCKKPPGAVEILVLVNAPVHTPEDILAANRRSYNQLLYLAEKYNSGSFKIIPLYTDSLPAKHTGAGIPRKLLMDEAVRRFCAIGKENGVIISLDADCLVEQNYLQAIAEAFSSDKDLCTATIEFHHPVEHLSPADPLRQAMGSYEAYLRYYRAALEYCGFPYPYYTIGSAMAFRVSIYTRAGGMGKQAAGEDFYFLQKAFPLGKTKHIDTTKVYPAARLSDRVPFGTGPAIEKMLSENQTIKTTYSFESFQALKVFFDRLEFFYQAGDAEIFSVFSSFPSYLQDFLSEDDWMEHLHEIRSNCSSYTFFRKRFFNYFNAFKVVKCLNFVHLERLSLQNVYTQIEALKAHFFTS